MNIQSIMGFSFKILFCAIATVATLTKWKAVSAFAASSSSPIPPPPPISVPVWSFATASQSKTSMNIMTFCIPVSVSSPKQWALSFYYGTLTKDSFLSCLEETSTGEENETAVGVLQLLKKDHQYLVPILGKNSGRDIDKSSRCGEEGFPWSLADKDFQVLPGCALYVEVQCKSSDRLVDAGDHVVAICEVTRIGVWEQENEEKGIPEGRVKWLEHDDDTIPLALGAIDESNALYSGWLRKEGIL